MGMQRYDARLVRDACGNADVLMKETHDGLFVRHADAQERERVLREALVKARRAAEWKRDHIQTRPGRIAAAKLIEDIDAALAQ